MTQWQEESKKGTRSQWVPRAAQHRMRRNEGRTGGEDIWL